MVRSNQAGSHRCSCSCSSPVRSGGREPTTAARPDPRTRRTGSPVQVVASGGTSPTWSETTAYTQPADSRVILTPALPRTGLASPALLPVLDVLPAPVLPAGRATSDLPRFLLGPAA